MDNLLYIIPLFGVLALVFMTIQSSWVGKQDPGTDKMKRIADNIADGAMSFLKAEYQVLAIFVSYFLFCQIHDYLDSDWLAVLPLPENAKEQRVLSFKSQGSNTQLNPIVSSNPPKPFETSGLFMK